MKKIFLTIIIVLAIACSSSTNYNMTINGTIKGLRKGTLYLQKIEDSTLVVLDSLVIEGSPDFSLGTNIESPEIFYLYLKKQDGDTLNDRIRFFGEKGTITINTTLRTFESSAKIYGSENHELLEEYESMIRKFEKSNLDLLKKYYSAEKQQSEAAMETLDVQFASLQKRKYLFAINYALTKSDKTIAPFIALSEVFDANPYYLDTIYKKLTPTIRDEKYGRLLKNYIQEVGEDN